MIKRARIINAYFLFDVKNQEENIEINELKQNNQHVILLLNTYFKL